MGGSALGSTAAPLAAGAASSGGKGGGQTAQTVAPTAPAPTQGQYSPMPRPAAPNVYQQSASALTGAQNTAGRLANFTPTAMQAASAGPANLMNAAQLAEVERMQGVGAVQGAQAPGQIAVNQLATTNLDPYMNPYTQNVIETGQADIERQRQMASNTLGAQAQAAGAFGGSRQAVQEGVLAGEALRQAGQLSAQQRGQAFETALQSGQFDIGTTQQARTLASNQQMQAETLGQQAREAAAAREQAARAGNMQAANAFAVQQAQFEQQARSANQTAQNTFAQAQAAREQAANQANYGGQFTAANVQAGAAGQLGNLSQTGFNMGQQIGQQQMQQGLMQQGLQQSLIDAARGQYQGFTGAPQQSLGLPLAALGATPNQSTTTQSKNPGLFDYLSLGLMASDIRLKKDIKLLGNENGHNVYSWEWTDEGKRIADPSQPKVGVMAQELQETHPHLVKLGPDGFLRVDYSGLAAEAA
jgi:hypothetical protein